MLSSCMVNRKLAPVYQLRNRHQLKPLILQANNYTLQGLGSEFRTVMHENNGTLAQVLMLGTLLDNTVCAIIFPVEGVTVRNNFKSSGCKGLANIISTDIENFKPFSVITIDFRSMTFLPYVIIIIYLPMLSSTKSNPP